MGQSEAESRSNQLIAQERLLLKLAVLSYSLKRLAPEFSELKKLLGHGLRVFGLP